MLDLKGAVTINYMQEEEKSYRQHSKKKPEQKSREQEPEIEQALGALDNMISNTDLFSRAETLFRENNDPNLALEQLVQESRVRQMEQRFELVAQELAEALKNNDASLDRLQSEIFELAKELSSLRGTFEQIISSHFGDESSQKVTGLRTRQQILALVRGVYEEAGVEVPEERLEKI